MKQVQENVIEQIFQNKSNMRVFYTQNSKKQRFTPTPQIFVVELHKIFGINHIFYIKGLVHNYCNYMHFHT